MSEQTTYVLDHVDTGGGTRPPDWRYRPATPADLIAAIRSAVESGSIEGEVVVVRQDATGASIIHMAGNPMADAADNLRYGTYLVIPLSDGEETE